MTRTLYCRTSGCVMEMDGPHFPERCIVCGRLTVWRTIPWDLPQPPTYVLSANDRRLLRSLRIQADD